MSEQREISVILCTSDYRGDHSADIMMAVELRVDETVQHLAERLLITERDGARFADKIELRLVQP